MAKLYFYYASMNAGKSTTLLQADFNYRERGMATMLWTSALDNRAADKAIESRIGLGADAHRFDGTTDLWASVSAAHTVQPLACVLIDEAQFLSAEHRCTVYEARPKDCREYVCWNQDDTTVYDFAKFLQLPVARQRELDDAAEEKAASDKRKARR